MPSTVIELRLGVLPSGENVRAVGPCVTPPWVSVTSQPAAVRLYSAPRTTSLPLASYVVMEVFRDSPTAVPAGRLPSIFAVLVWVGCSVVPIGSRRSPVFAFVLTLPALSAIQPWTTPPLPLTRRPSASKEKAPLRE